MIYKLVTRDIQYFCFPDRPMKGGDILDFQNGGNLGKGGVDLEKGGSMTPLTNYVLNRVQEKQKCIFKYAVHDDVTNFEVCGSMENSKI